MTVLGRKVVNVEPLRPTDNVGRRIDDWIVTLSNGLQIPVEVKSSTTVRYFDSAFDQISNELRRRRYVLFVGFFVSKLRHEMAVVLVKRGDGISTFRAKLKKLAIRGESPVG
jgi:hypothetical protein